MIGKIAVSICLVLLVSCGALEDGAGSPSIDSGVYVDSTFKDFLDLEFAEVKTCLGVSLGSIDDLALVKMQDIFDCPHSNGFCSGAFVTPNTILIGREESFKHEVIHYLLYVNTGSSDPKHESRHFKDCRH